MWKLSLLNNYHGPSLFLTEIETGRVKRWLRANHGLFLWRYHFASAERVTRSVGNNPGCGPGKQLDLTCASFQDGDIRRNNVRATSLEFHERIWVHEIDEKSKGFQKENCWTTVNETRRKLLECEQNVGESNVYVIVNDFARKAFFAGKPLVFSGNVKSTKRSFQWMDTAGGTTSEILDYTIMTFDPPWETRGVGFGVSGRRVKGCKKIAIDRGDRQPAPINKDLCYWCSCEKVSWQQHVARKSVPAKNSLIMCWSHEYYWHRYTLEE